MGCDIHLYSEVRRNGRWQPRLPLVDNPYKGYPGSPDQNIQEEFSDRSYHLFAILAGVRNYWDTDNAPITPIAEPRGVPDDASPEYLTEVNGWDRNGHTHSWYTLDELLLFDWQQPIPSRRSWIRREGPGNDVPVDQWAAAIQGYFNRYGSEARRYAGGWTMVDEEHREPDDRQIEWTSTYWNEASTFREYLLKVAMWSYTNRVAPHDIRLLFLFDN